MGHTNGPRIRLAHGADCRPLLTGHTLAVASLFGGFPYHGVPSRGMVMRADRLSAAARAAWTQVAPPLEDLLCGRLSLEETTAAGVPLARGLLEWYAVARECELRPLCTSAALACETSRRVITGELLGEHSLRGDDGVVEVRLMKEGQTSSVWLLATDVPTPRGLCLNVGRDREADDELLSTTQQLRIWHSRDPEHVCRIHWAGRLELVTEGETLTAAVSVSDWIEGAELHPVAVTGAAPRLAAISHFTMENAPTDGAPRQRAVGRWLSESEAESAWAQYTAFVERHTEMLDTGYCRPPYLAIDEGDLMWTGDRIVVVATSGRV